MFKSLNVNSLQLGMTKAQVSSMFGKPDKVLYVGRSDKGYEEVLQYRTSSNESYALTFFDDQLESYEFLVEEIPVGSQMRPPVIHPVYPPSPPAQQPGNNRPDYPPANNNPRPPSNNSRPANNRPTNSGRSSAGSSERESSKESDQSGNQSRSARSTTTDSQKTNE
jgi:hypothetical protein